MNFEFVGLGYLMRKYYFPKEKEFKTLSKIVSLYTRIYSRSELNKNSGYKDAHYFDGTFFISSVFF